MVFSLPGPPARATVYVLVQSGGMEATLCLKNALSDLKKIIDEQGYHLHGSSTTLYDIITTYYPDQRRSSYIEIIDDKGSKRINCLGSAVFKNDK